jgi:hypothetical protein
MAFLGYAIRIYIKKKRNLIYIALLFLDSILIGSKALKSTFSRDFNSLSIYITILLIFSLLNLLRRRFIIILGNSLAKQISFTKKA